MEEKLRGWEEESEVTDGEGGSVESEEWSESLTGEQGESDESSAEGTDMGRPIRLGGGRGGGRGGGGRRGKRLVKKAEGGRKEFTPEQRLMILDIWKRSGLPAKDFAPLVGTTNSTLYSWKKRFEANGPGGLMPRERGGPRGSRMPELTKRTILMLKESNPEYGCQRISDMLARGPALPASANAVGRVLREAGYELEEVETRPHRDRIRRFEREKPNQMWQTDLFSFVLKRQNRRVYLVAFMDDNSRFVVSYGLHASQSTAVVLETLRSGLSSYGPPEEILTDNGAQYITWRGKSAFTKELEKRGIRQVVSRPRHPRTLGKIERFWGSLWRECLEASVFLDLEDARKRVGLYIDHYNFHRTHQGIGGLVPADRYFGAAPEVLSTLKSRVAGNSLELARNGVPKKPFYMTGQAGGKSFSVHAEGERVILTRAEGEREEVELVAPEEPTVEASLPEPVSASTEVMRSPGEAGTEEVSPPGASSLDEGLRSLAELFGDGQDDVKEGAE